MTTILQTFEEDIEKLRAEVKTAVKEQRNNDEIEKLLDELEYTIYIYL